MRSLVNSLRRTYIPTSVYKKTASPVVYLDLQGRNVAGKVKVKLFNAQVPEAAENFQKMCEGFTDKSGKKVSFKGVKFTNHMKRFFMETEPVEKTVFGEPYLNESYETKFDRAGLIGLSSDVKSGKEESTSGFFVTLNDMPNLGRFVAVGEVVEGLEVFQKSDQEADLLTIKDCGFVEMVDEAAHGDHGHGHGHH